MFRIICFILGYFVGCVQTAYYVGKIMGNIDIREHGSGNAGTNNVARVMGLKAGLITFGADVFKAILVFIACSVFFEGMGSFYTYTGEAASGLIPGLYGVLGVIIGHNYPVQLKFKGGKGIACTLGAFLCINWQIAVASYIIGFAVVYATRYVSAASLSICLVFTVLFLIFKKGYEESLLIAIFTITAFYRHRANIKRLVNKTESKFSIGSRSKTMTKSD